MLVTKIVVLVLLRRKCFFNFAGHPWSCLSFYFCCTVNAAATVNGHLRQRRGQRPLSSRAAATVYTAATFNAGSRHRQCFNMASRGNVELSTQLVDCCVFFFDLCSIFWGVSVLHPTSSLLTSVASLVSPMMPPTKLQSPSPASAT